MVPHSADIFDIFRDSPQGFTCPHWGLTQMTRCQSQGLTILKPSNITELIYSSLVAPFSFFPKHPQHPSSLTAFAEQTTATESKVSNQVYTYSSQIP